MALKPVGGKYEGVWINELKNGDKSYYINYRDEHNKPVKVLVGKSTISNSFTARDAYSKLIEVKYKLQHDQEPTIKGSRTTKIKLDTIWDEYFKYSKANKKSWITDKQNYNKHIKPLFGSKPVKSLKSLDFEDFKQKLFAEGYEAQTVKHQLTLVKTIINHAIKHDIVKNFNNPLANGKVKMPNIDNNRQAFLTKEEAKNLLDILKSTHLLTYHLTVLLLFTGARFSEVTGAASQKNKTNEKTGLTWNNINFKTNSIYIVKTKKGSERHIYMNDLLLETIKYLQNNKDKNSNRVISNSRGGIVLKMPEYFMTAIESIIPGNKKKDMKYKITAHSLRHTHASWLAQNGLDILQIKDQLGHKDLTMTLRYSHLIPNTRHEATKALSI
ncbi:tyrosine-type recombinase/integrase [Candidatus Sulfurimonas baltica]|uniref:Tyrosine-type recombinase/integrase n=1 Tax=Candidatus Sulfurimonas baltica TaxID=2740404 RepID=A0A7S7LVJ3_9BACT|nr:tyrosine-type recombinase/integrase [Candidatus Sulfurimonas baltica]QOY52292.1 tyrosine-type recombinase/integrase [Candidatus Sulfurimonas baltica]